jgi:hypothetical protein
MGKLNRALLKKDYSWLPGDLPEGTIVYEYNGCTYGCISRGGIAVTMVKNETPFFEVPMSAVTQEEEKE